MSSKRTYGDPCGIARALDVIGDRWALLVIRELLLGPKRFTDLRDGLPSLGPDVLSQRLRELEQSGVVSRSKLPPPAASRVYALTDWGQQLEPVVLGLGRWGTRAPFPSDHGPLGIDAMVLALKTVFDPGRLDGTAGSFELRLASHIFRATVGDGRFDVSRGSAEQPDAIIETDPGTLQAVLFHSRPLDDALRTGQLALTGDTRAARGFLGLFRVPA